MEYEVTIGIPVFNVEKYIRKSLESALNQSFQSIEFLICDDCGLDKSMDIVREYQRNHPRGKDIYILRQPQNMGVSAARNRIIDEARGHFLFFMDSDDTIENYTISLLMEHQKRVGADIVFGSYDKIETYNGNRVKEVKQYQQQDLLEEDSFGTFANSHYGSLQTTIWNCCINLQVLRHSGLHFIDVNYWEDMAFMFELVPFCQRAVLLPNITYHYLCHFDSLSSYQQRDTIRKDEVLRSVKVANYMKKQCIKQKHKSYYPFLCYNAVMTSFYIVCYVLKNQKKISPGFTPSELRAIMNHFEKFSDILEFNCKRWPNLFLCILGKFPPFIFITIIWLLGKSKKLI